VKDLLVSEAAQFLGGDMRTFARKQIQPQKPVPFSLARSNIVKSGPDYHRHPVQYLQRGFGNQAMQRLLQNDVEEPEAKSTAAISPRFGQDFSRISIHHPAGGWTPLQVMRMAEPEAQYGQTEPGTPGVSERAEVPFSVHEVLRSPGQPLEGRTRDFMEPRFGYDFSHVRVHTDPRAAGSARTVSAAAYTVGNNIVFDTARYAPGTHQGQYLLAHELAHVVQHGARRPSQVDKLSMTEPGDAHERRADNVAAAVTGGGSVPSGSVSGMTLARQVVAGLADAGPRAPAAVAGVAAPAKAPVAAPAAPAKAPVAPASVTFGKVAADVRADRIPPTKSVNVPVTLANIPSGQSVAIDVEGAGPANGTATLTAGASLAASGNVTAKGGTQTSAGNAGKLKLRARLGATVVGRSAGFTVAAWPIDYTDTRNADFDAGGVVGLLVDDGWSSDGGGPITELDEVDIAERVDVQRRDNPPFSVTGAISANPASGGTSGYNPANAFTQDTHTYGKRDIKTTGLAAGPWKLVYGQLCLFRCKRTGVANLVMPASGFTITHTVWKLPIVGWRHMAFKSGASLTVEGRKVTAGTCNAASNLHVL
jgi:hypothetical protein